jgi:F-type H+-transporting ATPase subunit epsilon
MKEFHLIVSSPDGHILDDAATRLIVCGTEGELAVMAGHVPFVTALAAGRCRVRLASGAEKSAHVESGILSVSRDKVTLLSGSFLWLD